MPSSGIALTATILPRQFWLGNIVHSVSGFQFPSPKCRHLCIVGKRHDKYPAIVNRCNVVIIVVIVVFVVVVVVVLIVVLIVVNVVRVALHMPLSGITLTPMILPRQFRLSHIEHSVSRFQFPPPKRCHLRIIGKRHDKYPAIANCCNAVILVVIIVVAVVVPVNLGRSRHRPPLLLCPHRSPGGRRRALQDR